MLFVMEFAPTNSLFWWMLEIDNKDDDKLKVTRVFILPSPAFMHTILCATWMEATVSLIALRVWQEPRSCCYILRCRDCQRSISGQIASNGDISSGIHCFFTLGSRIPADNNHRISPQEHFWNKPFLHHSLTSLTLTLLGSFHPNFLDILQHHIAMSIKCLHTA